MIALYFCRPYGDLRPRNHGVVRAIMGKSARIRGKFAPTMGKCARTRGKWAAAGGTCARTGGRRVRAGSGPVDSGSGAGLVLGSGGVRGRGSAARWVSVGRAWEDRGHAALVARRGVARPGAGGYLRGSP